MIRGLYPVGAIAHVFFFAFPQRPNAPPTDMPTYLARRDVFSAPELDQVAQLANSIPGKPTPVGQGEKVKRDINRSLYRHLMPANETVWLYEKLGGRSIVDECAWLSL